jgi:diguanylate cyclase (GGDEF)-like protein
MGPLMSIDYGPFYFVHVGYIALSFVVANILYLMRYGNVESNQKKRLIRLALSSFAPWIGVFLNILLAHKLPLDYTALLFPFAILLIIYCLKEEHRISISPFARNLMFMSSSEGVIVVNRDKIIIDFNDKANAIFSSLEHFYYQDICSLTKIVPEFPCKMNLDQKTMMNVSNKIYQVYLRGIMSEEEELLGYVYSFTDVTENINLINQLKENEEKTKELIYRDVLTSLPNRNYLDHYLKEDKHLSSHYILMIDMNELKYVNDHFGHQQGDQLIVSLANLVQSKLNENDIVIRLSGDEFLIFSHIDNEEDLKIWIQSLVEAASSIPYLSFAVGYANVTNNHDITRMYKIAEDRMYQNKKEMKLPKR